MKDISNLLPEIIIEILLYCNEDVANFAEALSVKNEDIWAVVSDKKLWVNAVIPPENKYFEYLGSYTKSLHIESKSTTWSIPMKQMKIIKSKCTALEELTIVNSRFYLSSAPLSMFPRTISHLKLVDVSQVCSRRSQSRFHNLQSLLPRLECLEFKATRL